ncbi:hypothetical protein V8E54_006114 [Elaphomyces granulatus]
MAFAGHASVDQTTEVVLKLLRTCKAPCYGWAKQPRHLDDYKLQPKQILDTISRALVSVMIMQTTAFKISYDREIMPAVHNYLCNLDPHRLKTSDHCPDQWSPSPPASTQGARWQHGTNTSQAREEIVVLGNIGYNNAVKAMMGTIGDLLRSIEVWNDVLVGLGEPVEGEKKKVTERRQERSWWRMRRRRWRSLSGPRSYVTKRHTTPCAAKLLEEGFTAAEIHALFVGYWLRHLNLAIWIEVSVKPHGFTKDWSLIELYEEKIDRSTFQGNKAYVGGSLSIADFATTMFPQPSDRANYQYPWDGLLQAYGVVKDDEIRNPQHLDVYGEKCLLVVKNGLTTGTTVGRTNGLESFTRIYDEYGIKQTSIEIAVLPYDKTHRKDGRIVGILDGGAGPTDETDTTYLTPYWWIEQQIKSKYPGCFLYDVDEPYGGSLGSIVQAEPPENLNEVQSELIVQGQELWATKTTKIDVYHKVFFL